MSAEADAICGAPYGASSPERTNVRNGYRPREFDTRTGTLELAIPKLRSGSYFPDRLLERRRRAEAVLTTVVATCYLLGVSTRRMEKLVETFGINRLSKSQVSLMAKDLGAHVADFRSRPLDAGPYTFVAADALVLKVREGGRVVNVHALLATGVNADGHREIWRQLWSNNPQERLNREIRGAPTSSGIDLPRPGRLIRLVGAVLAEQHDEWTEGRRYLGLDVLARARMTLLADSDNSSEVTTTDNDLKALSA